MATPELAAVGGEAVQVLEEAVLKNACDRHARGELFPALQGREVVPEAAVGEAERVEALFEPEVADAEAEAIPEHVVDYVLDDDEGDYPEEPDAEEPAVDEAAMMAEAAPKKPKPHGDKERMSHLLALRLVYGTVPREPKKKPRAE